MPSARSIGIVSIAIAGGIIFLLLIIFLTGTLTLFGRHPADFLPAENTVAVLHNVDNSVLTQYTPWFPQLLDLSDEERSGTIAIVVLESGSSALVRFTKEGLSSTPRTYWPYTVYTSNEEAEALLQTRLQSLTKKSGYRNFMQTKKKNNPWIYVQRSAIPPSESLYTELIKSFVLQDAKQIGIANQRIELYHPSQQTNQAVLPNAPTNNTIITSSTWDLRTLLERVQKNVVLTAFVQQHLNEFFGSSVSLEYDILPLFEQNVAIDIQRSDSGTLLIQLSGTHSNAEELHQLLSHLQESRKTQLPNIELLEMQLDRQFRMRTLRNNSSANENNTELYSVQHDRAFILANHASLLQLDSEPLTLPNSSFLYTSNRRATGWLNRETFRSLLHEKLVEDVWNEGLPFLPLENRPLMWLWEERGPLTVISFFSS